jgi:hypothetical protein
MITTGLLRHGGRGDGLWRFFVVATVAHKKLKRENEKWTKESSWEAKTAKELLKKEAVVTEQTLDTLIRGL